VQRLARGRLSGHRFVVLVIAVVVGVRLLEISGPLHPDEAGLLMVARSWHLGGPELYGHYFVDRPPLLLALFRVASLVGWQQAVRVLLVPFAALLVVSAAWAARQLVGERGARWAAVVAGALAVTPLLGAEEADAEMFAAPLVMLSVAVTIAAVRRAAWPSDPAASGRSSGRLALLAGLLAGAAVRVKQSFVDAVVFAAVLLVAAVGQRLLSRRVGLRLGAVGGSGVLLVLLGFVGYATWSGAGLREGWFTLFSFRGLAFDVLEDHGLPWGRAGSLLLLAVACGLVPLLAALVSRLWRTGFTGPPVAWAVGITAAVGVAGVVGGGSYWPHYLVQLAPMAALAAGLWGPQLPLVRVGALVCAASATVAVCGFVIGGPTGRTGAVTGQALGSVSRAGDTATVLYGNPQVQQASGLRSPYPQLWTLPMRTLDPGLRRLDHLLTHRRAPTWLVEWLPLDSWGIDRTDRTGLDIATHYHPVGSVCGHQVLLRDGLHRPSPSASRC
jgi:hypothetical protein